MIAQLSLIYTTFSSEADAIKVTRELLEKRLIACVNVFGNMKSICFWKGNLEESQEVAVFLKTTTENIPAVITMLEDLHPYELPVILEIPVRFGAEPFSKWIQDSVR